MSAASDPVWPIATALLDCLCAALPDTKRGSACVCCVYPGDEVPMDHCCGCTLNDGSPGEGQAFVTAGRQFRSGPVFPQSAIFEDHCAVNGWAVDLSVGVYRCAATLGDDGSAPACSALESDSEAVLSDMAAIRQILTCCFPGALDALGAGRFAIGDILPVAPQGACMGSQGSVTVEFFDCCPEA